MPAKIVFLAVGLLVIMLGQASAESACNGSIKGRGELPCLLYAAEQGDAHAQHNLGFAYAEGKCSQKNIGEAYAWWAVAAMNGIEEARTNMERMQAQMTPVEFEKAQITAIERFLRTSY